MIMENLTVQQIENLKANLKLSKSYIAESIVVYPNYIEVDKYMNNGMPTIRIDSLENCLINSVENYGIDQDSWINDNISWTLA